MASAEHPVLAISTPNRQGLRAAARLGDGDGVAERLHGVADFVLLVGSLSVLAMDPAAALGLMWTLAWDNHALLTRQPLVENFFYPTPHAFAYTEPLLGIGLFSLPLLRSKRL
jgi:hypothetical protein